MVSKEEEEFARIRGNTESLDYNREKGNAESSFGRISHQVQILQKFFTGVARVSVWLWWNFGNPLINKVTVPIILFVIGWYIKIWNRYVYPKDKYGVEHFSMARGAKLLVGTLVGAVVSWNMLWVAIDATLFVLPWTSQHEERVYLFGTTDNSFADDNWSVTGCKIPDHQAEFECSNEDTLYYRIQPSLFNYLWHISWHNWNPFDFFLPEVVAAPVAPGWNECKVTSYGLRVKFLIRNLQWYLNLLATDCKPILLNKMG